MQPSSGDRNTVTIHTRWLPTWWIASLLSGNDWFCKVVVLLDVSESFKNVWCMAQLTRYFSSITVNNSSDYIMDFLSAHYSCIIWCGIDKEKCFVTFFSFVWFTLSPCYFMTKNGIIINAWLWISFSLEGRINFQFLRCDPIWQSKHDNQQTASLDARVWPQINYRSVFVEWSGLWFIILI